MHKCGWYTQRRGSRRPYYRVIVFFLPPPIWRVIPPFFTLLPAAAFPPRRLQLSVPLQEKRRRRRVEHCEACRCRGEIQVQGVQEGGALKSPIFGKGDEVEFAGWWWHWRVRACLCVVECREGGREEGEGGGKSADGEEYKQEAGAQGQRASRPARGCGEKEIVWVYKETRQGHTSKEGTEEVEEFFVRSPCCRAHHNTTTTHTHITAYETQKHRKKGCPC